MKAWTLPRLQFALLTLLIILTLTCALLSIQANRAARERHLIQLIESYHAALADEQYSEVAAIAQQASKDFPNHPAAAFLLEKQQHLEAIRDGRSIPSFACP